MKTRISSAIIITAIFVPFLLIGGIPFAVFMSAMSICGLYELFKVREMQRPFPTFLKLIAYVIVALVCLNNFTSIEFKSSFEYRTMAFIIFLFLSPMVFINDLKKYGFNDALFLIGSVLFIGLSFNLIIITRNFDLSYIIYLLLITVITDTFALVTGMLIGKNKLCPKISPNKTVEGLIGGLLMGTFVSTAFYVTVINPQIPLVLAVCVSLVLCLVAVLGDLVFSAIKRDYAIKDFSKLIPGHGGILDRFDSLIFVTLAFIVILEVIL